MIKNKLVGFLCLVFVLGILATGCGHKKDDNNQNEIITLSQTAVNKAGIKSETVQEKEIEYSLTTTAQVKANEDSRYVLSSVVSGKIIKDCAKLGDYVKAGQVIALVQNPDVVKINSTAMRELHENNISIRQAQTKYNLAKSNYNREVKLYSDGISPQRDLIQAKSDMLIARDDLESLRRRNQDIRTEARAMLNVYGAGFNPNSLSSVSPIRAMKSGVITKKNVTVGAVVSPEQVLYEVQDLSKLWLDITLYSDSISKIKKNQLVTFVSDSFPDKKFFAKIDYIQPVSDDVSQTFIARAFIDNSLGLLKSGMFGKATIKSDVKIKKVFVPEGAVQKYGKENFVFLDLGDNKYKKVNVELGEKVEGGYFINSGIQVGDIIVTKGSFTLKAEMLKSEFEEED